MGNDDLLAAELEWQHRAESRPEYRVVRQYGEWPFRWRVVHSYGGTVGEAFTLWGARRVIRNEKRTNAAKARPAYREAS